MKVNHVLNGLSSLLPVNEGPTALTAGETVQVVIKERLSDNQAKVLIKGQEVTVKFEGSMPPQDRFTVSVVRIDEKGQLIVKPQSTVQAGESNQAAAPDQPTLESDPVTQSKINEAIRYLTKKGYPLTKEARAVLQQFFQNGNADQKMAAIQALAQRKLDLTPTHLFAIHSALNEEPAASVIQQFLQAFDEELPVATTKPEQQERVSPIKETGSGDVPVEESQKNQLDSNPQPVSEQEETAVQKGNPHEVMNMDEPVPTLDSKSILVTKITKELSQMTIDFSAAKRETIKFLDHVSQSIDEKKPIPATQVKQLLETAIQKLDQAILKGNYMLYADMGTEKALLSASSQLAKAKEFFTNGSYSEAGQIVKEVKSLLNSIQFKPSDSKIMHFVSEQSLLSKELPPQKQVLTELQQTIKPITNEEPSARQVFETVKRLGLLHENQTAHQLMGTTKGETEPNLKAALLKMIQLEEGQPRTVQSLEQALTNLTGQQLLNKPDSTGMQNVFMQLPLMLHDKMEQVKVFVNSQKQGKGLDWENCSLYFVLETERLGRIGIQVNASQRNLSITLKTDRDRLAEDAVPFTDDSIQRLNDIGYRVGHVTIKPFEKEEENTDSFSQAEKAPDTEQSTERGYDVTI